MDNSLSNVPLHSVSSAKSMLRDLIKLLGAALPETHFSQLITLMRRLFRDEESHHAAQLIHLMNRMAQVRLLEHLNPAELQHRKMDMLTEALSLDFEIHHLQLKHNFWLFCIESDRPELERLIRSFLPLSRMGGAFKEGGFKVKEHAFLGINLMMVVDGHLDKEEEDEEAILLFYPHLHLAIRTVWSRLAESLNPYFHPSTVYSQSHLLEGRGLFHHHELMLMVLHVLAASQLSIDSELNRLHVNQVHVQQAFAW